MARRLIAIPLAVAIAIAVFLFPTAATDLPPNDYVTDITFKILHDGSTSDVYEIPLKTGQMKYYGWSLETVGTDYVDVTAEVSLNITNTVTIYIVRLSGASNMNTTFSSYRDASGITDYSYTGAWQLISVGSDSSGNLIYDQSTSRTFDCQIVPYRNVPVGSYKVTFSDIVNGDYFAFGMFVAGAINAPGAVQDYIDGNISFADASNQINDDTLANIAAAESNDGKIVQALIGQIELDRLVAASNDKSLDNINNTFAPALNSAVTEYTSGAADLSSTLSTMQQSFASALDAAETPEQGILANTTYQIKLKELEIQARIKARDRMDEAIDDTEVADADDYYQKEQELLDQFDLVQYEALLDFQTWNSLLPQDESLQYKEFFDYFLQESPFRMFIIIPMTMVLVTILLGTRLHFDSRAPKMSDEDKYWKSVSDNYWHYGH